MIYTLAQLVALTRTDLKSGRHCSSSPLGVYDTLPTERKDESVAGIAALFDAGNRNVGWIYRSTQDRIFVQINGSMTERDESTSPVKVDTVKPSSRFVSGISLISVLPWKDLRVLPCGHRLEPTSQQ
jgi:hypothetical protein